MTDDLVFVRRMLAECFGSIGAFRRREPIWQLVRSMIGSRTRDTVTGPALTRVMTRWPNPVAIARADRHAVLRCIAEVTFAEDKARHLVATLRQIGRECPDYDLTFLSAWPARDALNWLERLPGVGPKIAAATLNASTLAMPVFIVDSHVHRILLRFGFVGEHATAEHARDVVTATGLEADELLDLFVRLKRLGQEICHWSTPECGICPLAPRCQRKIALGGPQSASAFVPFKSRANAPRVPRIPGGPLMRG